MKNYCEICRKKNLPTILNLGKHPLCDDLIKIGSKKKNKLYKIEVVYCKDCVTAYQKFQVKKNFVPFKLSLSSKSHKRCFKWNARNSERLQKNFK